MANITLTVLGARGSMPVSGKEYARYGGRTTSFIVATAESALILDAGTGLPTAADLGLDQWHLLLTHYHADHLQGLHFFGPLYEAGSTLTIYGSRPDEMSLGDAVAGTFKPPFFPIVIDDTPSHKTYVELTRGPLQIGDIEVSWARLNHPQGVTGYRFSTGDASIVVATDHEAGDAAKDAALRDLAQGTDVLLHDAQYTPDDYDAHRGWGHSTWEHAAATAEACGAASLVLTSHDPSRSDEAIDTIVSQTRAHFPRTAAAYEGLVIEA